MNPLFAFLYVVFALLFGYFTRKVALNKGQPGTGFFWLGFFLGLLGLIIVLCLTDNPYNSYTQSAISTTELQQPLTGPANNKKGWICPHCGNTNTGSLSYCLKCKRDHIETIKIKCPSCYASNNNTNTTCWVCDASLHQSSKSLLQPTDNSKLNSTSSVADEIAKLKQLADQGIITFNEFMSIKDRLLSKV